MTNFTELYTRQISCNLQNIVPMEDLICVGQNYIFAKFNIQSSTFHLISNVPTYETLSLQSCGEDDATVSLKKNAADFINLLHNTVHIKCELNKI